MNSPKIVNLARRIRSSVQRSLSTVKANRIDSLSGESQEHELHSLPWGSGIAPSHEHAGRRQRAPAVDNYIALACFSAMSPITGSFHIWPW